MATSSSPGTSEAKAAAGRPGSTDRSAGQLSASKLRPYNEATVGVTGVAGESLEATCPTCSGPWAAAVGATVAAERRTSRASFSESVNTTSTKLSANISASTLIDCW